MNYFKLEKKTLLIDISNTRIDSFLNKIRTALQVFKSKYEDSPYTRQEVEEMETSSHTETTSSTTTSSLPGTSFNINSSL